MPTELEPVIGTWYEQQEDETRFEVVAIDEDNGTIEIQDIDGNLNEIDIDEWYTLDVEVCEGPEDWSDIMEDDEDEAFPRNLPDTSDDDYDSPFGDFSDEEE